MYGIINDNENIVKKGRKRGKEGKRVQLMGGGCRQQIINNYI